MSSSSTVKLVIGNCDQIVQVCSNNEKFKSGKNQDELSVLQRRSDGVGCSLAIASDGRILRVGYDDELSFPEAGEYLNGVGYSLIPGLIDAHSHPVWAGDRVFEFDLKMRGASYLDVHSKGGGIYYTVEQTKLSSEDQLLQSFLSRLKSMIECGTTLVECKTGYGLEFETEIKMLDVIERARRLTDVDLVTTFLGAHAKPKNLNNAEAVESVIGMMRKIAELGKHNVEFVDVFCEKGVFDVEESKQILTAGKEILKAEPAFHGDELNPIAAAELAAEVGARSVSHLEFISKKGIEEMSKKSIAAIICPTTAYLLKLKPPPVREMIEKNVPVVIGSDFNPNAHCYSLPMAMNLAAVTCNMTLNECLVSTTINAAYALNKSDSHGSLEPGKIGDCVMVNATDWRHLIYQFGDSKSVIKHVIKKGNVVV